MFNPLAKRPGRGEGGPGGRAGEESTPSREERRERTKGTGESLKYTSSGEGISSLLLHCAGQRGNTVAGTSLECLVGVVFRKERRKRTN